MLFGILNINKPTGVSSRYVVDQIQRFVRPAKAGHAGTLDPLATGVLVLCIGPATRLVEYIQRLPKSYRGRFLLGRQSRTDDIEGTVTRLSNPPIPSRSAIECETHRFIGTIEQQPPIYSAIKVGGRRAYALARAGERVELPFRKTTIHAMRIVEYSYPELVLDICCSSGTYVRAIGRDLAKALGSGAVMSGLTRTAIGRFHLEDAYELKNCNETNLPGQLLSPVRAVEEIPQMVLTAQEAEDVCCGRKIFRDLQAVPSEVAGIHKEQLLTILRKDGSDCLAPAKVFPFGTLRKNHEKTVISG